MGAFDGNSVLLNNAVLSDSVLARKVYAEEVGHALDKVLNHGTDFAGDEGAIFQKLLSGETISTEQMAALRAENDHGKLEGADVEFYYDDGYDDTSSFFDDISGIFDDAATAITSAFDDASNWAGQAWDGLDGFTDDVFGAATDWAVDFGDDFFTDLGGFGDDILTGLDEFGTDIAEFGTELFNDIGEFGDDLFTDLGQFGSEFLDDIGDIGTDIFNSITDIDGGNILDNIVKFGEGIVEDVKGFGKTIFGAIDDVIIEPVEKLGDDIAQGVKDLGDIIDTNLIDPIAGFFNPDDVISPQPGPVPDGPSKEVQEQIDKVIDLLNGDPSSADQKRILDTIRALPDDQINNFIDQLEQQSKADSLFNQLNAGEQSQLLSVLVEKGARVVKGDDAWYERTIDALGNGFKQFDKNFVEGIKALFQIETYQNSAELGKTLYLASGGPHGILESLAPEAVEDARQQLKDMVGGIKDDFVKEWNNAEAQGRELDLGVQWVTTGFLNLATAFIGDKFAGKLGGIYNKIGVKNKLLGELSNQGIKHTPENIIDIAKTQEGRIVFLETGNNSAGLKHIVNKHADDFIKRGITEDQIPDAVMAAVTKGKIAGYQGAGKGRPIYEFQFNGQTQRIAVTTSNNGFIVGANPN
jgi:filamentous hemagglutinin